MAPILFHRVLSINFLFLDTLFRSVCSTFVPSGYISKYIYPLDFSCCFLLLSVVVYPCTFSHLLSHYHASMLMCHVVEEIDRLLVDFLKLTLTDVD